MSVQIPIFQDKSSDFEMIVTIQEQRVKLHLVWNTRAQYWYINEFAVEDTTDMLHGVKIRKKFPLLDPHKALLPNFQGDFIVWRVNNESAGTEITYENFGVDWVLLYLTEAELLQWKIDNGLV